MGNYLICFGIFRILLPIILGICVAFRPSVMSAIYLLFLCYFPFVPVPTPATMKGHTGFYLKLMVNVSVFTTMTLAVFHLYLFSHGPYGDILKECSILERILRTIGLVKVNNLPYIEVITWTYSDPLMLVSSIAVYWSCNKLANAEPSDIESQGNVPKKKREMKYLTLLTAMGRYALLASMCFAAIIRPSIFGGLYFFLFLSSATWWACYKKLKRKFAILMRCFTIIVFAHILLLYAYQTQWPQEIMPPDQLIPRLFGMIQIFRYTCDNPRTIIWNDNLWDSYAYLLALYLFYATSIFETKLLMNPEVVLRDIASVEQSEHTPLMKGSESSSKKYGLGTRNTSLIQDSLGSVTVPTDATEDIPMNQLEEEYSPTICDNVVYVLGAIFQLIIKSSYIGTNIVMMTWSITYLSWITFVLLLWANLVWLVPNQRKAMLRSSPCLVFYAWFLLISAYVFCLDLTEEELPSTFQGWNLAQIGFQKIRTMPFGSLATKCLFTGMFWITLRQYMQEKATVKHKHTISHMAAPLQVTVGTAAGVEKGPDTTTTLEKFGKWFRNFLASIWILVVASTLFLVSVTGQKMTGFRIVYMALFLVFVVTFQLSYKMWKKIMLGFWMTVIIYSMLMLIMVYTYQFDHVPEYWQSLGIPEEQQMDIGLERYDTKELFLRLFTPTFFIIVTVIQVHYFHDDFMKFYEQASEEPHETEQRDDESERYTSVKFNVSEINPRPLDTTIDRKVLDWASYIWNLSFLFLELHMAKLVLIVGILACLIQPCALDFVVVVLLVIGTVLNKRTQQVTIYACTVFFSALLLCRMVYQIKFFQETKWQATCYSDNNTNWTVNDAEWMGFKKIDKDKSLMYFIRWDIIFIIVATLLNVVKVRQMNLRSRMGIPHARVEVMFPSITRADADKDLSNFFKYMVNYGYYKFGVEICLIMLVALIGFRMDFYALLYAIWLCCLFTLKRETLSRIWNLFILFTAVLIPVQYFMVIGIPPSLCIVFPWRTSVVLQKFQEWAFLMDSQNPLPAKKLICDYLLLLLICRQSIGFKKEHQQRSMGLVYPGGSNEVIIQHLEEPNFENPVPDYITYCRSYLDVFKRAVLLSMLWISLAVLFLAGTNRVNIFSIGYLIGAFVFLWQGTDLYLWPIPVILKRWNYLLTYNVAVITLKAGLQIVGCLFMEELTDNVCWPVQVFAIGCVNKFITTSNHLASDNIDPKCTVPREYIGLVWDGLGFTFLIMQRRIFHSFNFFHMIDEAKASTILASRGAELIDELRMKRMHEQEENERKVLEKIKSKMDRIKATQQKIQAFKEATTHHLGQRRVGQRFPETYKDAIRSGDYYMFDDPQIDDIDPLEALPKTSLADTAVEIDEDEGEESKYSVGEAEEQVKSVKIQREPIPSTSKEEGMSELIDADSEFRTDPGESRRNKIKNTFKFIYYFIDSLMVSATRFLNRYTRDYRYVIRVLKREKKNLKETTEYSVGVRTGKNQIWEPAASFDELIRAAGSSSLRQVFVRGNLGSDSDTKAVATDPSTIDLTSKSISLLKMLEEEELEMSSYDQPSALQLLLAMWYIVSSKSELMCYISIFLNQVVSATFLSLPLPLMVFLWGTMTIPRPTKTFWVTIIAYTEVIVLIKCMFQFDIIPWNRKGEVVTDPLYLPRILGIERKANYAVWDLFLLLMVFFHRFMLKSMGLWQRVAVASTRLEPGIYEVDEAGEYKKFDDVKRLQNPSDDIEDMIPSELAIQKQIDDDDEDEDDEEEQDEDDGEEDTEELDENKYNLVKVKTEMVDGADYLPETLKIAASKYTESWKSFISQLIQPTSRVAADVYSYMFLCDFINFFVLLLGYTSFGTNQGEGGGVTTYLEDNKIPVLFLLMLIIQFMLIIIDRGIYLRKNLMAKIIFQYFLIIFLHLWLFILYPTITERSFNSVLPPQIYYMVKCFYLLLSAYQVRCGYPTRILGNFLCKGYGYVNMFLFKAFLAVPFLFELRTVMDWMWTDTSMTFFDWIKMEDIFAHIFQLKCQRHIEAEYPQPRGEKKKSLAKYFMGGFILLVIIGIIWFPLVFFSLGNAVGKPNIPFDVTVDLRIGPYDPVYQMSAQDNNIFRFSGTDYDKMLTDYESSKQSLTFITNYEAVDIAAVKLSSDSANIWTISPPDRKRMIEEVNSIYPITVRLNYKVSHRTSKSEDSGILSSFVPITIPPFDASGKRNPARINLSKMLETDGNSTDPVLLIEIIPKFLKITNSGVVKPIGTLMDHLSHGDMSNYYRNASLFLHHVPEAGPQSDWWKLDEDCSDRNYRRYLSQLPYQDCEGIVIYTFNDKIFPSSLSFFTAGGIVGLYTTFVLLIFHYTRGFFMGQCFKIMYEDLPYIDRILQLVYDIYLVRESNEFVLEEDLFAKLIFLFRSPETLIKWTRPIEEGNPDDEDND